VIGFSDLGRRLSPEQPLYGLQAPHMDVDHGPLRIEDMARTYLEEIRTVQPEGPYVVGGWCLGGDVAFEMAQQLREAGSEVALVLMVDNARADEPETPVGLERVLRRASGRLSMEWANLAEVPRGGRGSYAAARTARLARQAGSALERLVTNDDGVAPFGLAHSRSYRQEQIAAGHIKAYWKYRPRPYPGAVAIFRAQRRPLGQAGDPSLGWGPFVTGQMTLYELPGHRIGLLTEPRARHVVPIIERAIHDAFEQRDDGGP